MQEIKNLEIKILKGEYRKDEKQLNELLSDDFVEFGGKGIEYNKQEIIQALLNENNIEWDFRDMKPKNITDNVVMINYIAIKKENDSITESLRTSIWKKFGSNYKMIFHQGTNIIKNMELGTKKQPSFKIDFPKIGDEVDLAPMHIQSWKETYVNPESGLTEEMVDEKLGHMLTNTDFRRNTISEAIKKPDEVLYRVVRNNNNQIVGFIHGSKHEEFNELDAIYLLNEVKGSGVSGKLMKEFLDWIDKSKPTRLEVFSCNERAINFYKKYGFVKTDKPVQIWKDTLPFIEMIRPVEEAKV